MADIIIDNAGDDSDVARRVAAALEAEGFSVVSCDEKGAPARRAEDAAATLVLWSPVSVKSHRIRKNAAAGAREKTLIPVLIGDVDPPKGFRRYKTADLRQWRGDQRDPNWLLLLSDIRQLAEEAGDAPVMQFRPAAALHAAEESETPPAPQRRAGGRRFFVAAGALAVVGALSVAGYFLFPLLLNGSGSFDVQNSAAEPDAEEAPAVSASAEPELFQLAPAERLEAKPPDPIELDEVAPDDDETSVSVETGDDDFAAADDAERFAVPSTEGVLESEAAPFVAATTSETESREPSGAAVETAAGLIAADADAEAASESETAPPEDAAAPTLAPGVIFRDCDSCPEMTVVPAGAYVMGSPEDETNRDASEGPTVSVTIEKPFAIGRFEVTFAEWDACVADGGCDAYDAPDPGWGRGDRPAVNVSWRDARAYAGWLSEKTGATYRLPSEAEWEYVARAGGDAPFSFGAALTPEQANYDAAFPYAGALEGASRGETLPVGSFPANGFGVYDMHGNVWEWVADCWRPDHLGASAFGAPRAGDCVARVLKGGAWNTGGWRLRAAHRIESFETRRDYDNGFRLVRELD